MSGQFTLGLSPEPGYSEHDFCHAPSNAAAWAWLARTVEWPNHRLAVWGDAGCGKTHLLHIWANRTGAALCSGRALTGPPEYPSAGIALDNADAITDEHALLHLLNAASEAGAPLLLAGRPPPARWPVQLPDLASRLRAMTAVEIDPPEDGLRRMLVVRLLSDRQLRLPNTVQAWLVRYLPRSAAALREAIERLDSRALAQHRTITVPFAAETLADMLAADEISTTRNGPSPQGEALK